MRLPDWRGARTEQESSRRKKADHVRHQKEVKRKNDTIEKELKQHEEQEKQRERDVVRSGTLRNLFASPHSNRKARPACSKELRTESGKLAGRKPYTARGKFSVQCLDEENFFERELERFAYSDFKGNTLNIASNQHHDIREDDPRDIKKAKHFTADFGSIGSDHGGIKSHRALGRRTRGDRKNERSFERRT